jgi:predicted nucleic acid-binding protein
MKHYLLDSYAIISYLNDEKGAESVSDIFTDCVRHGVQAGVSIVNYGEVLYHALRLGGKDKEYEMIELMKLLPLSMLGIDFALTRQAASYKAFNRISYAGAFAAATARIHNLILVTGDKEFKQLEKEIEIKWIR